MVILLAVFLLFRIVLPNLGLLCFHIKLKIIFSSFYEELHWKFDGDCVDTGLLLVG